MTQDEIRRALIAVRKREKVTQGELAVRLGVTQDWVSRHEAEPFDENGERVKRAAAMTVDDARAIARALGYDLVIAVVKAEEEPISARALGVLRELAGIAGAMSEQDLRFLEMFARSRGTGT
jgi:transcriptional regulator with XRE-family HTH domain